MAAGTQLQAKDSGTLSVTSTRIVFLGRRSTIELPYSRLMDLEPFDDGARFHVSGRTKALLFQVAAGHGQLLAAYVAASVTKRSEKAPGQLAAAASSGGAERPSSAAAFKLFPEPERTMFLAWERHRNRLTAQLQQPTDVERRYRDLILLANVMTQQLDLHKGIGRSDAPSDEAVCSGPRMAG